MAFKIGQFQSTSPPYATIATFRLYQDSGSYCVVWNIIELLSGLMDVFVLADLKAQGDRRYDTAGYA
jgi:hypothetical protein